MYMIYITYGGILLVPAILVISTGLVRHLDSQAQSCLNSHCPTGFSTSLQLVQSMNLPCSTEAAALWQYYDKKEKEGCVGFHFGCQSHP
jgi:hypothetical protein